MLDQLALAALGGYRRWVSPHKGFRCAYGAVHRRGSCSDIALRIARRFGARRMLLLLPLQAARCRAAFALAQSGTSAREEGPGGPANRTPGNCGCDGSGFSFACGACTSACWGA
jgi:hypothetical protein